MERGQGGGVVGEGDGQDGAEMVELKSHHRIKSSSPVIAEEATTMSLFPEEVAVAAQSILDAMAATLVPQQPHIPRSSGLGCPSPLIWTTIVCIKGATFGGSS